MLLCFFVLESMFGAFKLTLHFIKRTDCSVVGSYITHRIEFSLAAFGKLFIKRQIYASIGYKLNDLLFRNIFGDS